MHLEQGTKKFDINEHFFLKELERFDPSEVSEVMNAYHLVKGVYTGKKRLSGDDVFLSHCYKIALDVLQAGGTKDMTIAALGHDLIEDAELIKGEPFKNNEHWISEARLWLASEGIAEGAIDIIAMLTKPRIDGIKILTETQRKNAYIAQLEVASEGAQIVKLADRYRNVLTLEALEDEYKQDIIIEETVYRLMPMFLDTVVGHPEAAGLYDKLDNAVCDYRARNWND